MTAGDHPSQTFMRNENNDVLVALNNSLSKDDDSIEIFGGGNDSIYITTATTTEVFIGPGVVEEIRVVGGTLGNVTIYDNESGTSNVKYGALTPANQDVLIKNELFSLGCRITTAAATHIKVTYRQEP